MCIQKEKTKDIFVFPVYQLKSPVRIFFFFFEEILVYPNETLELQTFCQLGDSI